MPNNRRRKLSPRLVNVKRDEQKDGSPQSRQVPSDASMCHGSYSNRDDCNYSESSCDIMADGIENLNLDVKQAKGVRPTAFFIGPELPKVELSYFDGQPRGYWKFLREFETYVESRVKDDGQRLLYLIHYCKGKAKTAIEGCVMLEASFGYKKAKEILKRLFGQAHVIARETLEDLFKTTNVDYSDPEQLTNLAIRMENCSMVLKQMKYTADLNSLITLERIVGLLPQVMQAQWADWVDELTEDNREPTFDELTQFIASRARVANSRFGRLANRPRKGHNLKTNCHLQLEQANNSKEKAKCSVCSLDHAIYKCPNFLALTVQERWSHAKVNGICFVCLRQGHKVSECKLAKRCNVEGCERKHHSLLHSESEKPGTSSCCGYTKSLISQVCLGMIPVRLKSRKAEIVGYALLDNGSDVTLIRSNCLRSLGLSEDEASVVVETVGGNRTMKVTSAPFEVYSLDQSEHVTIEGALVVASIPGHKPTKSAMNNLVKWPHLRDVPIGNLDSEEVLLLIGCDVPEAHWVLDQRLGGRKGPYAVKTLLGWTVFGPASYPEYRKRVVNHTSKIQALENEIRKLYDVEFSDVYSNDKSVSIEDKAAISIVEGGTRFENGHFVVPIPWKGNPDMKGGNYEVANSRLRSLKRRLLKDDILYIKYTKGIESNFIKGYAEKVPEIQVQPSYRPRWYLPHHAVLNPKKPEKLRVVFDCAAKFAGVSLNDMIYQGPDTTAELVCILLRFRKEAVAISADVEEMFMQVKVPESDRGALRFLWWQEGDMAREPSEFQMTSHPFGATSSPFCANFALNKTAQIFSDGYDGYVVDAVKNNFYVDDCLVSFPTCDQAKSFVKQISELLCRGGFKLKKWVTNSEEVRTILPDVCKEESLIEMSASYDTTHRTLGVEWDFKRDVFKFYFDAPERPLTRRGILSIVSSLFDPLGLIAPVCLTAKVLLQKLCKSQLGWDQPLNEPYVSAWLNWVNFMRQIGHVTVDRGIKKRIDEPDAEVELHLFSDASEIGYGAVAYARVSYLKEQPYCILLYSKSRVAPIKQITIPRLEMAAAVLSVRLSEVLRRSLPNFFCKVNFHTDSMVVLYYIKNIENRYSTYIANRLAIVHQYTKIEQWSYVRSSQNPADWTSRGIQKMSDLELWFKCPTLLHGEFCTAITDCPEPTPDDIEFRKTAVVNLSSIKYNMSPILAYYSEWLKLVRAVAWLRRFIEFLMVLRSPSHEGSVHLGCLKVKELDVAKRKILLMVQKEVYGEILSGFKTNGKVVSHNDLKGLSPIMLDGLLCVGGRLSYSDFSNAFKHPIILPSRHLVTEMIIRHYHKEQGHTGTSQVLATIRKRYWIIKGTSTVKRVIGKCVTCRRYTMVTGQQLMAPLPACRVQQGWYCFSAVGVDYFGPLFVKRGRSLEKRYGCVFTCLQTRAVHIEMTHSLNTDSFIMALLRFIGRRGKPAEIYSDNGSNFVGAVSELKRFVQQLNQQRIDKELSARQIQWHFNPPSSSHRGGVWERMIRSIRRLLLLITREQTLTDETLSTYLIEVERILNDRPLTPVVQDANDQLALSPNSLLLLRECDGIVEEGSIRDKYDKRWKQVNHLANVFWKRWLREYLPSLQKRQKWLVEHRNFQKGDVVIVASDISTRGKWPLGVVEDCKIDDDGRVRTVVVRTNGGLVRRDIRRLCLLEGTN
ncbi:unnamed protein product [Schistosoma mattheei]|uniref:Integrase catalytic domain-containing protein n=1 Tax=Schistosoma mattheei TaxID=31246 RepID=A0AA85BK65_9TREM|nr:unnamed protein product [Schistosoma mattheei]